MLVEGMGCEKTEENRQMGFRLLSLAADQNEPNALLAMRQVCIMQGDDAGVNSRCTISNVSQLTIFRHLKCSSARCLSSILKRCTYTDKCKKRYRLSISGCCVASVLLFTRDFMLNAVRVFFDGSSLHAPTIPLLLPQAETWRRSAVR